MIYIKLLIFFSILSSAFCESPYNVRFVSYTYEYVDEFFEALTIKLLNNSQMPVLNGSAIFSRDMAKFSVSLKLMVNNNKKRKAWQLLDVTFDPCQILKGEGQRSLSFIHNILKIAKPFGHIVPDKCPFIKSTDYYLDNFYVDSDRVPIRLSKISLNISVTLTQKSLQFYKGHIGLVVEDKKMIVNGS